MKEIIYKIINKKVKEILKMISIKKVSVTPLPKNNGQIIDSFNTSDNKHTNAPSIFAVQEKLEQMSNEEKLQVREENVMVPLTIAVDNKNSNGVFNEAFNYGNINFPLHFEKCGNNVLLGINFEIWKSDNNTFHYEYIDDKYYNMKCIRLHLPWDRYANTWRIRIEGDMPTKYKGSPFVYINDQNELHPAIDGVWLRFQGGHLRLYVTRNEAGSFFGTINYFGANTD